MGESAIIAIITVSFLAGALVGAAFRKPRREDL
ncbi:hypothetical protein J2T31_002185 [Kerstersia gyiorum]|nr:hypothetical protein [Kerstersia gyiorum]MCP1823956.1 hypothetical protein [Kerstersia gyiorum]MCP1827397.1 hypothetical protein [Kerstersia gyiorum]MCW2448954.1 hypothetical protein [Kerstersia gyiorum]